MDGGVALLATVVEKSDMKNIGYLVVMQQVMGGLGL
jgi:hypothetical protein